MSSIRKLTAALDFLTERMVEQQYASNGYARLIDCGMYVRQTTGHQLSDDERAFLDALERWFDQRLYQKTKECSG